MYCRIWIVPFPSGTLRDAHNSRGKRALSLLDCDEKILVRQFGPHLHRFIFIFSQYAENLKWEASQGFLWILKPSKRDREKTNTTLYFPHIYRKEIVFALRQRGLCIFDLPVLPLRMSINSLARSSVLFLDFRNRYLCQNVNYSTATTRAEQQVGKRQTIIHFITAHARITLPASGPL